MQIFYFPIKIFQIYSINGTIEPPPRSEISPKKKINSLIHFPADAEDNHIFKHYSLAIVSVMKVLELIKKGGDRHGDTRNNKQEEVALTILRYATITHILTLLSIHQGLYITFVSLISP